MLSRRDIPSDKGWRVEEETGNKNGKNDESMRCACVFGFTNDGQVAMFIRRPRSSPEDAFGWRCGLIRESRLETMDMYVANENGPTHAHQQQAMPFLKPPSSCSLCSTPRREKEESLSEAGLRIGYHCIVPWLSSVGFI